MFLLKFLKDIYNYFNIEKQYYRRRAVLKGDEYKNFYNYLEWGEFKWKLIYEN